MAKYNVVRIQHLLAMLKENRYFNYSRFLAEMKRLAPTGACKFSARTLLRDIEFLKREYRVPIDQEQRNGARAQHWGRIMKYCSLPAIVFAGCIVMADPHGGIGTPPGNPIGGQPSFHNVQPTQNNSFYHTPMPSTVYTPPCYQTFTLADRFHTPVIYDVPSVKHHSEKIQTPTVIDKSVPANPGRIEIIEQPIVDGHGQHRYLLKYPDGRTEVLY